MENLRRCSKRQYSGLELQRMLFRSNKPWLICLRISRYSSCSVGTWLVSQLLWRKSTEGGTVGIIALENYSPNQNKKPKRHSITLALQSGLLRFRRRRGRVSGNGPLRFHRRPLRRKRTLCFCFNRLLRKEADGRCAKESVFG